jgi:uncharacterized OB-fold protein
MTYLPGCPLPDPTPDDLPFWDACKRQELRVQRCLECRAFRFPPKPRCPRCLSVKTEWEQLSGGGSLFAHTVVHHIVEDAFVERGPYNVCVIDLDGADGIRILSNVVDADESELEIGMRVEVVWEEAADGVTLPRFKKQSKSGAA